MEILFKNSLAFIKQKFNMVSANNEEFLRFARLNKFLCEFLLSEENKKKLLSAKEEDLKSDFFAQITLINDFSTEIIEPSFKNFCNEILTVDSGSLESSLTSSAKQLPAPLLGFYHDTRANAKLTSFFKQPGNNLIEVHAIGFHTATGNRTYKLTTYWQPTEKFKKNAEIIL